MLMHPRYRKKNGHPLRYSWGRKIEPLSAYHERVQAVKSDRLLRYKLIESPVQVAGYRVYLLGAPVQAGMHTPGGYPRAQPIERGDLALAAGMRPVFVTRLAVVLVQSPAAVEICRKY